MSLSGDCLLESGAVLKSPLLSNKAVNNLLKIATLTNPILINSLNDRFFDKASGSIPTRTGASFNLITIVNFSRSIGPHIVLFVPAGIHSPPNMPTHGHTPLHVGCWIHPLLGIHIATRLISRVVIHVILIILGHDLIIWRGSSPTVV